MAIQKDALVPGAVLMPTEPEEEKASPPFALGAARSLLRKADGSSPSRREHHSTPPGMIWSDGSLINKGVMPLAATTPGTFDVSTLMHTR